MRRRVCVPIAAALTTLAIVTPSAAAQVPGLPQLPGLPGLPGDTPVQPYGTNDGGGFWNILPPGANGFANAADIAPFFAACPPPKRTARTRRGRSTPLTS